MATDRAVAEELLEGLFEVRVRPMMGEYVLYCREKVIGDICDNRLFIKITPQSKKLLAGALQIPPYLGAKPYFLVQSREKAFLQELFVAVADGLPLPKKRKS